MISLQRRKAQQYKVRAVASSLGIVSISTVFAVMGLPHLGSKSAVASEIDSRVLAQTPSTPVTPRSRPVTPRSHSAQAAPNNIDNQFAIKAAQSDQTEIQTSQLALQKSTNLKVRQFAEQMIQQHTASTQKLMPIAMKKGVALPKDVGPINRPLVNELSQLSGAEFDREYMIGQVQAHAGTQATYQSYLREGRDPELKAFATQVLPIVGEHLQMAQGMVSGGY
jgi:putative membrane protein